MNKDLRELIYRDHRFENRIAYLKKYFLYPEIELACKYRKASFYTKSNNKLLKYCWLLRWRSIRKYEQCQISLNATIGAGMRFVHVGPRVITAHVKIGIDCMIGINVIIGYGYSYAKQEWGEPIIGDRVYIGHNTSIVGSIKIGNDVLIAPNAFVNRDVPDNCIVIGNNIHVPKEKPTMPYINDLLAK